MNKTNLNQEIIKDIYILDDFEQYMKQGYESIYLQWRSKQNEPNETRVKENERYSLMLQLIRKYNYMIASCQDFYYIELLKLSNEGEI
ncbi:MAG TPA: hypothetical protein VFX18_01905 [Candidatus Nitrosocosmicus sp.]|nr:hypothetical protein [Candidatus Nitrosocosmicus sp.]